MACKGGVLVDVLDPGGGEGGCNVPLKCLKIWATSFSRSASKFLNPFWKVFLAAPQSLHQTGHW